MSVWIADLYFEEPMSSRLKTDIIRYNQWSKPVAGATCTPFSTIVLDLTRSPQELLSKMKIHTRYKIRRASDKDELLYSFSNGGNPDAVIQFADHFDRCAALKNLPKSSRQRLNILAHSGALDVSFVRDKYGEILAASSYVMTPSRVRGLLAGASYRATTDHTRRTLIGRANRYLYWRDILRFKEAGLRIFDFGGYYTGNEDQEKVRINGFKDEFAGEVLYEFNCQRAVTPKGKAVLWAMEKRAQWQLRRRAAAAATTVRADESDESSVPASI